MYIRLRFPRILYIRSYSNIYALHLNTSLTDADRTSSSEQYSHCELLLPASAADRLSLLCWGDVAREAGADTEPMLRLSVVALLRLASTVVSGSDFDRWIGDA